MIIGVVITFLSLSVYCSGLLSLLHGAKPNLKTNNAQRTASTTNYSPVAEVVKLSRRDGVVKQDCDVYIGRRVARGGWDLPQSKWHNPFHVRDETREARLVAIEQYEEYLLSKPELMNSLHELRGKRLGCWCKTTPDVPCHGDVLVRLLEEQLVGDSLSACSSHAKYEYCK